MAKRQLTGFLSTLRYRNTLGKRIWFLKQSPLLLILTWKQRGFCRDFCMLLLASGVCPKQAVMSSVPLTFCLSRCPVIWFHFLTITYTGRWYSTSGHWIRPKMTISGCTKWLQDLKKKIISREGLQKESKHSCCCPTGQQSCAELHKRGEEKKLSQRQDGRIHTDKREAEEASWLHSSPVLPQAKTLIKAKRLCKSWFLTVFLNLVMNRLLRWAGLQSCWTGGKKTTKMERRK